MRVHGNVRLRRALAPRVARKRRFFDAAVNSSLLERLERSGLRVGQARFGASLGKNPAPAARVDEKKFNRAATHAIADRRNLLRSPQLAKIEQSPQISSRAESARHAKNPRAGEIVQRSSHPECTTQCPPGRADLGSRRREYVPGSDEPCAQSPGIPLHTCILNPRKVSIASSRRHP